ncbi:MAG: efflux RND transporter periplasmic adaptor subunit [Thermodesulfovibrionales bacterium]|nr:efflux RND transporter periplasmic adaptor subunit [Thermodesulfovibrionales bacterium]
MNRKRGLIKVFIIIFAVICIAVGVYLFFSNKDKTPQFKTEKVTKGNISATVTATGTLSAVTTVAVGTQVSGTIKEIYVDYNSPVKKGQLIALIDPDTFQAQVNQARANLNLAKANLKKSEVSLQDAERNFNRYKTLIEKELIARSEFDTAQTNLDSAKAQVEASKAQVLQAEAALKAAEINLDHTRIVSPVDGVVISRSVDVGQTVAASFQTPTLFSIAKDLTKMQVVASIVEADIGMVKNGQSVEFTVDAHRETVFKGKVSEVRIAPITVQNVVTYEVIILVDNLEHKLKPGMTANVSIIVDSKDDVLKIPNSALRFRMPEALLQKDKTQPQREQKGRAGTSVWILKDAKPKRIPIKTGISDGQFTEIVSGEIKEGDEVIIEAISKSTPKQGQQSGAPPRLF